MVGSRLLGRTSAAGSQGRGAPTGTVRRARLATPVGILALVSVASILMLASTSVHLPTDRYHSAAHPQQHALAGSLHSNAVDHPPDRHQQCDAASAGSEHDGDDDGSDWCENAATNPELVVDDRGHICHVKVIGTNGCCPPVPADAKGASPSNTSSAAGSTRGAASSGGGGGVGAFLPPACRYLEAASSGGNPAAEEEAAESDGELGDWVCSVSQRCCSTLEQCVACCMASDAAASAPSAAVVSNPTLFHGCVRRCRHSSATSYHQNQYSKALHHCFGTAKKADTPPK